MTKFDLEQEKYAIDIISGSMYALNFLRNVTMAISNPEKSSMTVKEFYDKEVELSRNTDFLPYDLGVILGNLYCGLLLAKEYWFKLLPDDELSMSDPEWCLLDVTCTSPKEAKPTVKYVIKRIRHALAHGNIIIKNVTKCRRDEKKITIEFHDENQRDSSDTFDIELSLFRLIAIMKKFQRIAYEHVTSKMKI